MAVMTEVYTIGTAIAKVVTDSADSQDVILQNLEPEPNADDLSRDGYLYLIESQFTLTAGGTGLFNIATPPGGMQIEFYELVSTAEVVRAELVEGATPTTGATVVSYNINRNFPDDSATVFTQASALTGGSVISAELITGSKQGGGGAVNSVKIHTLRGSEDYGMRFVNQTQQETDVFVQLAYSEKFNGQNAIWVGDGVNDGIRLGGGQRMQMRLQAGQTLWAVSEEEAQLAVLRQD